MNALLGQQPSAHTEKSIRLIIISFAGIFFYMLVSKFWMMESVMKTALERPLGLLLYAIPFIIAPFAAYYFWKKRATGWHLLTAFLTYSLVEAAWILFDVILFRSDEFHEDNYLLRPTAAAYIVQLFLVLSLLITVCKRRIRLIYQVDKTRMYITFAIVIYATAFLMAVFSW